MDDYFMYTNDNTQNYPFCRFTTVIFPIYFSTFIDYLKLSHKFDKNHRISRDLYKGIWQWMINLYTSPMMIKKLQLINYWMNSLGTFSLEPTNQCQKFKAKAHDKTLGTSIICSPMSPPSLDKAFGNNKSNQ